MYKEGVLLFFFFLCSDKIINIGGYMNKEDKTFIAGIILAAVIIAFAVYSMFSKDGTNNSYRIWPRCL